MHEAIKYKRKNRRLSSHRHDRDEFITRERKQVEALLLS
jgi:hypothetical protein